MQNKDSGLRYEDLENGSGKEAVKGKTLSVHYTGWVNDDDEKGHKFDSSLDRGQPFVFKLGAGQVIKGWDEGFEGMKVGGKRTLYIPSNMAYGARGIPQAGIPANADLIFDVELVDVK